jgi:uncharacterized protein
LLLAQDLSQRQPLGYLSDFSGVVEPARREAINTYLSGIERSSGVQIAIVTVDTLKGEPIERVANDLYRRWGIGKKETNRGALFLLAIQDRKSRLEVGYGLEPELPDGAAGAMLREMRPALRKQRYGDALETAARQLGERVSGNAPPLAEPDLAPTEGQWVLIVIVILLALLILRPGGRRRGWIWYGGGGGFGGYSSGQGASWGGFGGGDSGGGGASSDW